MSCFCLCNLNFLDSFDGKCSSKSVEFASFPSRDASGRVIGITRRYDDGAKKTLSGTSNSGVFSPTWLPLGGPVFIVEGASDVAALITHNFAAIGRPSNVGGSAIAEAYLNKDAKGRRAIVVGENDQKTARLNSAGFCTSACDGCARCYPGKYGAKFVAKQIGCEWRMVPSAYKDMRQWANSDRNFAISVTRWING